MSVPADVNARQAFLDAVLADAEDRHDHSARLAPHPEEWRLAIVELLDGMRAELSGINADLKAARPGSSRSNELDQQRADVIGSIASLETRLRHVKSLIPHQNGPLVVGDTPLEQIRAHLYAALNLLRDLED